MWEECKFHPTGDASQELTQKGPETTSGEKREPAREDEGPIHGSTPPHGDVLGHQVAGSEPEFDADAEEQPLIRA